MYRPFVFIQVLLKLKIDCKNLNFHSNCLTNIRICIRLRTQFWSNKTVDQSYLLNSKFFKKPSHKSKSCKRIVNSGYVEHWRHCRHSMADFRHLIQSNKFILKTFFQYKDCILHTLCASVPSSRSSPVGNWRVPNLFLSVWISMPFKFPSLFRTFAINIVSPFEIFKENQRNLSQNV